MDADTLLTLYDGGQRDFSGEDLRGVHLAGRRLPSDPDAPQLCLADIDLSGANLSAHPTAPLVSQLSGVDFTDATFYQASLFGADLRGCVLTNANFDETLLSYARLSGAELGGATFSDSLMRSTILRRAHAAANSFAGANMIQTYIECADLRGSDLSVPLSWGLDLSGVLRWLVDAVPDGWEAVSGWATVRARDVTYRKKLAASNTVRICWTDLPDVPPITYPGATEAGVPRWLARDIS